MMSFVCGFWVAKYCYFAGLLWCPENLPYVLYHAFSRNKSRRHPFPGVFTEKFFSPFCRCKKPGKKSPLPRLPGPSRLTPSPRELIIKGSDKDRGAAWLSCQRKEFFAMKHIWNLFAALVLFVLTAVPAFATQNPSTGDNSMVALALVGMGVAAAAIAAVLFLGKGGKGGKGGRGKRK
jgi:LPXTG-motif cell wall-anchored protein